MLVTSVKTGIEVQKFSNAYDDGRERAYPLAFSIRLTMITWKNCSNKTYSHLIV